MKAFYIVCACTMVAIAIITASLRRERTEFYGIADTKELDISWEKGVEIKKVHVVPGEKVKIGDTIVELSSQELDLRISQISHELDELRTRKAAHANMSKSEIRALMSQQDEKTNELRAEIQQLESQLDNNRKLLAGLKSVSKSDIDGEEDADTNNPAIVRIINMKKELGRILDSSAIKVQELHSQLSYSGDPISDQVNRLEDELKLLSGEKSRLFIVARISGIVGSVNHKDGENIAPFASIATIHSESPSFVRGYIPEIAYSRAALGQKVAITSLALHHNKIEGEIVGVGTRIVEFPLRLRKMLDIPMWGREITIKIPESNPFLLGEKLLISLSEWPERTAARPSGHLLFSAFGAEPGPALEKIKTAIEPVDMKCGPAVKESVTIEASGALYCKDLKRYLIVSDDTRDKLPILFLMDSAGTVDREAMISGLEKINDMESITENQDGVIYVASSQSVNKKGVSSKWRRLLVRIKRNGDAFTSTGTIVLLDALTSAARQAQDKAWSRFLLAAVKDSAINVEGMACRKDTLFLGFKNPLQNDSSIILKLTGIGDIFKRQSISPAAVTLWKTLHFIDPEMQVAGRISDMQFKDDTLYIVTRSKTRDASGHNHNGNLWQCVPPYEHPVVVLHLPGLRPEGLAFNTDTKQICIVCDNGQKIPSQVVFVKERP